MRHLRHTVLAALTVALCAAPASAAHDPHQEHGGAVVSPANDKWLGEFWAQIFSLPVSENPFAGNGNPCMTVGRKVIQEVGGHCTIVQGTTFTLGFGTEWSSVDEPFPQTRAEQLALATAWDRENVVRVTVAVDGGHPVQIRIPRFELFSPQRTVLMPADNVFEIPGGPKIVTLSAHGWGAAIRKLSVGEHTIVLEALLANGELLVGPHPLTVVPRHDHTEHGHDDD
jgi:hypothetical protein